jgi:hypothetical protein
MAKTSSMPRRNALQGKRLPWKRALPLIAALSTGSWVAMIGVIYLGRRLARWLVGS